MLFFTGAKKALGLPRGWLKLLVHPRVHIHTSECASACLSCHLLVASARAPKGRKGNGTASFTLRGPPPVSKRAAECSQSKRPQIAFSIVK
eukprot:7852762-Pyramimonas_sp.AAC.1